MAGQAGLHSQMLAGKLDVSETASALIHENDPGKKKKKNEKNSYTMAQRKCEAGLRLGRLTGVLQL